MSRGTTGPARAGSPRGSGASRARAWRPSWLAPAVVALVTFAAFIPALSAGFVSWDDDKNFIANLHWRGLGPAQLQWMWTTFHMGHYVPLSWMTLGLDYTVWGMNAFGYHLTNVVLHTVNAVLVYFVARAILRRAARESESLTFAAALAALLFSVHPLRVESVAWITERRDVLSGCLFTFTILAYLRTTRGRGETAGLTADHAEHADKRWYWASVFAFVCGMLAKASVMTVPAVLFVLNVYPLRRLPGPDGWIGAGARRVYAELVPFAIVAAATAGLSIVALKPPDQLALGGKLAVSAYSLAFYLAKTFVPMNLAPLYEMPKQIDALGARYLMAYAVTVVVASIAWAARKRWPAVTTATVIFVIVLLPTIGFVQNGPQIAADRYTYHAAPALEILVGAAFLLVAVRWPMASRVAAAACIVVLGAATWQQSKVWHDSESVWTRVIAVDSTSSIGQVHLATEFARQNRLPEAIDHYELGLRIDPAYAEGHNNLGVALARAGRPDDAVPHYERAVALKPSYDEAYSNWGIALARQGDLTGAIEHYQRALALNAENVDAQVNWGNALVRQDKPDEAIPHYQAALAIRPDDADAHLNWGVALARQKDFDGAIRQFTAALDIQPGLPEAKAYLERAMQLRRP